MLVSLRIAIVVSITVLFGGTNCRSQSPSTAHAVAAPGVTTDTTTHIFALIADKTSLIYIRPPGGSAHRLTARTSGWEGAGVLSRDGSLVAYSSADAPLTRSEIWIARPDGSNAKRVSGADEDAIMPAFGADNHTLFYVRSGAFGHASPIAASRRHKFDVMKVTLDGTGSAVGAPVQLTNQELYDVSSLSISPDGRQFLLCLSRYPIGSVIEEYDVDQPLRIKATFQPHVAGETSSGAIFGGAAYVHDGMDIVFTAASGGFEFDYNVYQISAVTGSHLLALTHGQGAINAMTVDRDGTIFFVRDGHSFALDPNTRALREDKL